MTKIVQLSLWVSCPQCGLRFDAHHHRTHAPEDLPPVQVAILDALRKARGPRTGTWIAQRIDWSTPTVYRHLPDLIKAGRVENCGKRKGYKLIRKHVSISGAA